MFYAFDVGLGFLATVRLDGGPRVHPVCPIFVGDRLYTMVIPGPKLQDLKRDSRYALHSETFPPPREDDGFYVSGRVVQVDDPVGDRRDRRRSSSRATGLEKWPGFDDQVFFELLVDRALLTLTARARRFRARLDRLAVPALDQAERAPEASSAARPCPSTAVGLDRADLLAGVGRVVALESELGIGAHRLRRA